jgi:chromosome segregation ATPase
MVVNGKRIAVKPDAVIFSERELDIAIFNFLQKVDDSATASPVKELVKQRINVAKPEEVQQVKQQVSEVIQKMETLKESPEQIVALKKELASLREDIMKKLDKIKQAVETLSDEKEELENVVHELEHEVYENGAIVIEGLDETHKKE